MSDSLTKSKINIVNGRSMFSSARVVTHDGVWMINYLEPFLYFYDFSKKYITIVRDIPKAKWDVAYPYSTEMIMMDNDKLLLIPFIGEKVVIYHINDGSFAFLDIDGSSWPLLYYSRKAFYYNNWYHCIPVTYPRVIKIKKDELSVKYGKNIFSEHETLGLPVRIGDLVYSPNQGNNKMYIYNLGTEQWSNRLLDKNIKGIVGLYLHGKDILAVDDIDGTIWQLEPNSLDIVGYRRMEEKRERIIAKLDYGHMLIRSMETLKWKICDENLKTIPNGEYRYLIDFLKTLGKLVAIEKDEQGKYYIFSDNAIAVAHEKKIECSEIKLNEKFEVGLSKNAILNSDTYTERASADLLTLCKYLDEDNK